MEQPLCFSEHKIEEWEDLCYSCRVGDRENLYCTCENVRYSTAVLCKVFTVSTPAHNLDITTPLKYVIYDLSGNSSREVDQKFSELIFDHTSDFPVSYSVVLDGSSIEQDYRDILSQVSPTFYSIYWDFKGKFAKARYIEFASQLLSQVFVKKEELVPENDHLTQRKKEEKEEKK